MGVIHIFLKNIREEYHIDSLEVNKDLSDLKKQNISKPMRLISLEEYLKIEEENSRKFKEEYTPGNLPGTVMTFTGKKWKGFFETTRNLLLSHFTLIAEKKMSC